MEWLEGIFHGPWSYLSDSGSSIQQLTLELIILYRNSIAFITDLNTNFQVTKSSEIRQNISLNYRIVFEMFDM